MGSAFLVTHWGLMFIFHSKLQIHETSETNYDGFSIHFSTQTPHFRRVGCSIFGHRFLARGVLQKCIVCVAIHRGRGVAPSAPPQPDVPGFIVALNRTYVRSEFEAPTADE